MKLSEKELMALQELLSEEELIIKKFQMLAEHTEDTDIKQTYQEIAGRHQQHFNELFAQL